MQHQPNHRQRPSAGSALAVGAGSVLLLCGVVFAASYFVQVQDASAGTSVPGSPAGEESGSLQAAVQSAATAFVEAPVTLEFDGASVEMSWAELGVAVDPALVERETARLASAGTSAASVSYGGEHGSGLVPVSIDRAAAEPVLVALKGQLDRGPESARLDLERRIVHPAKPGFGIDVFGSLSAVEAAARGGSSHVALEGADIPPTVTVADLGIDDISTVIAHFETKFAIAERSRNDNLKMVASHIDGVVLRPGETFSFNKVVGDRTEKEGYKIAHVITAGQMVDGMAGGACQISTTLHGAVFFAGLQISDTTPHSRPSTYVPLGFDATVAWPSTDFVFKNSFPFSVAIHYKVARGEAKVEILGKEKPFDKVEFIREVQEEKPFDTITREDDGIGMGYMVVDQAGYPGYKILRRRLVYKKGKKVREDKWTLNYKPVVEYVRMGVNPNPNLAKPKAKKTHIPKPAKGVAFKMSQP